MTAPHDALMAEVLPLSFEQFGSSVTVYPEHGQAVTLTAIVSNVQERPRRGQYEDRTDEEIDVKFLREDWDDSGLIYPQKRWKLSKESDPDPRPWMFSHVIYCGVNVLSCRFTRSRLNAIGALPQQ